MKDETIRDNFLDACKNNYYITARKIFEKYRRDYNGEGYLGNEQASNGHAAIHSACIKNHIEIIKFLIEKSVYLNIQTSNGKTPLMLSSNPEICELLVQAGARIDTRDGRDLTALMYAADCGQIEKLKFLCDKGAKLNIQDSEGKTALMIACLNGRSDIVEVLINESADLDIQSDLGITALMHACSRNNFDIKIIALFIEKGANVNIQDASGKTALEYACNRGNTQIAVLLINSGADYTLKNASGLSLWETEKDNIVIALIEKIELANTISLGNQIKTPYLDNFQAIPVPAIKILSQEEITHEAPFALIEEADPKTKPSKPDVDFKTSDAKVWQQLNTAQHIDWAMGL